MDSSWSDGLAGRGLHLPLDAGPGTRSWLFLAHSGALSTSLPF